MGIIVYDCWSLNYKYYCTKVSMADLEILEPTRGSQTSHMLAVLAAGHRRSLVSCAGWPPKEWQDLFCLLVLNQDMPHRRAHHLEHLPICWYLSEHRCSVVSIGYSVDFVHLSLLLQWLRHCFYSSLRTADALTDKHHMELMLKHTALGLFCSKPEVSQNATVLSNILNVLHYNNHYQYLGIVQIGSGETQPYGSLNISTTNRNISTTNTSCAVSHIYTYDWLSAEIQVH